MASPPSPPPPPEPARIHSLPNLRTLGLPSDCFEIPEGSLDVAMVNTDDPNSIEAQFLQLSNCILGSSADFATKVGLGVGIELKRTGKAFSLATLNHLETSVLEKGATGDLWSQLFELETNSTNTNTNTNNNYLRNTLITTPPSSPNNTSSVLSSSLPSSVLSSSNSSGFVGVESGGGGGGGVEEEEEEEERKLFGEGDQLVIDHHGFIVDEDSYTSTDSSDRKAEREASEKWLLGLTNWDAFLKDKLKMKRMLRKGIPEKVRGSVWMKLSKLEELKKEHPTLFRDLLNQPSSFDRQIRRDIPRTFPKHIFFFSKRGMGQLSLYNCLKAFSVYDPVVGYCQGMGFVTAVLLLYMTEEDAFFVLMRLCEDFKMKGIFEPGFPLLHQCFNILEQLMQLYLPRLTAHFANECVETSTYATTWFTTLFTYTFDFALVVRIWDMILAEGLRAIYRIALGLLKLLQPELLKLPFEEIVGNLRTVSSSKVSAEDLLHAAFELKLSAKKLEKLEANYLASIGAKQE